MLVSLKKQQENNIMFKYYWKYTIFWSTKAKLKLITRKLKTVNVIPEERDATFVDVIRCDGDANEDVDIALKKPILCLNINAKYKWASNNIKVDHHIN